MSSKTFHRLQDPLAKRKVLHVHLKVIPTWFHLSALCNALWQMSNRGTATPQNNYPQAAFSPGYRHKGLITPSRRAVGANLMRSPAMLVYWLTWGELHELFQRGFDGYKAVGLMCLTPWLKEEDSFSKGKKIVLVWAP